ncbi:MAG: nitrile hydratase accessory protein [Gammaproteobacteria bacterium]
MAEKSRRLPLPNFGAIPNLPRDNDEVVFAAPWEAKAFALVIHLYQQGCFEWREWVNALAAEIAADHHATPYYELWLSAAEKLIVSRRLVEAGALRAAREEAGTHAPDDDHHHH